MITRSIESDDAQKPVQVLTHLQAPPDSFHDCHVYGFGWGLERYAFAIDLDYIVEWIQPRSSSEGFRFAVSRALLLFKNADDVKISLSWMRAALVCQIDALRAAGARATPNGVTQVNYVLELSEPDGQISLWSTGYDVLLLTEPMMSDVPALRSTADR